jgi:hypothetical protein
LETGSRLERERRWAEALSHYEDALRQHPQRPDLHPPEDDDHERRGELPEELPFGADVPAIVDDAEQDHDRRTGQVGPHETVAVRP